MAKNQKAGISLELTMEEAREVTNGIDLRLRELDKLFKNCKVSGMMDAAEKVAKAVGIIRGVREMVDGSAVGPQE